MSKISKSIMVTIERGHSEPAFIRQFEEKGHSEPGNIRPIMEEIKPLYIPEQTQVVPRGPVDLKPLEGIDLKPLEVE